jgi:hypothetical protein
MVQINRLIGIKNILSILFLTALSIGNTGQSKISVCRLKEHKTTSYFGSFKDLPQTDLCLLYDGEVVSVKDGSFSIKDQMLSSLNFIFVDPEQIHFTTEENTVLGLILNTTNYKCFELSSIQFPTPSSTNNNYSSSWKIFEKKLDGKVPFNSIVVPLNPNTVNISLQNAVWKPNNLVIKLPIIKLKAKDGAKLKDLMVEGYLKAISLKPFHAKQKIKSMVRNAIKVSMIV